MSTAIAIHLAAAAPAVPLGVWMLSATKGTPRHKALGRVWVSLMLITIASSLWIPSFGEFSAIHLLSAWTLISLVMAVSRIRAGRIRAHRGWMIGTMSGLCVAFVLSLGPGRLLGGFFLGW